ncbi:MAG: LCP family protein [Anaerolineae bacterium]|nr:LCP family protein [Anaerolineae bacterium]
MKASSPWLIPISLLTLLLFAIGIIAILLWGTANNTPISRVLPTFVPIAVAGADTATRSLDETPLPATYTPIPSVTAHPNSSPTPRPSLTPTAEPTLTPSQTPTPRVLAPGVRFDGTVIPPLTPPVTAIPTAVPTFAPSRDITTILLLGSDTVGGVGRTDTMILVAVNRNLKTASMLSLPRDLYVYIPGWTMNRLNTAMARGESSGYPGGGVALLMDTIKYNFGVQVDYYAQVDFVSFKTIVDAIGGVELVVTCSYADWRLKSPELNPHVEDNWEIFTLERGVQQMDGDLALWYARSRLHSSDFDRGRRQQQLLRAMFNKGVDVNLLSQIPTLWETYRETVRTNLDIGTILQLASIAPQVRQNGIQNLYLVGNDQIRSWTVPETGAAVQLPNWERMQETFTRLYLPPSLNRATRPPITVELLNATGDPVMSTLTAENLAWYGFIPIVNETPVATQTNTVINYYASNFKGSYDWLLSWVMNEYASTIQLVPDTPYPYNYQITIGTEYNPCRPSLYAPKIDLE